MMLICSGARRRGVFEGQRVYRQRARQRQSMHEDKVEQAGVFREIKWSRLT